jgi:hypothetical protein
LFSELSLVADQAILTLAAGRTAQGEQVVAKDYKRFPTSLPLLVVHGDADKASLLYACILRVVR